MDGGRRSGGVVGLLASVAIHAAIAAVILRRGAEPPARAEPPVQVDVVHVPRPIVRVATPPPPAPPPPARTGPLPASTGRRAPAPAPAPAALAPSPSEPAPVAVAGPSTDLPRAPAADVPRAATLDLELRGVPDVGIPVLRERLRDTSQAPVERSPAEMIVEQQGRRRVENGQVDPYFAQLGRVLIESWNAEQHVQRRGLSGWMQQMSENTQLLGSIWQENARRYARAGSPIASDTPTGGLPTVIDRTGGINSAAARDAYQRQIKEQFTARKRALLRVVQNRDGLLRSVTLVEGSNEPAIDREAIADVRAAASRLPPPPQEGLGIKEPIVSLWEFQLTVSISPPVPTISFEFDEALAFFDVRMPLDRRIYKRVKLVSVE